MSGTVNIARSIFDHELFADQPLTEREAWIWLIMEASWKPRKKRVGDYIADLARGQLAASVRFMAGAWRWSPAKVQRFLSKLKQAEMISQVEGQRVTIVTIENYESFQSALETSKNRYTSDTDTDTGNRLNLVDKCGPADTGENENRYTSDTNEKKDEIKERDIALSRKKPSPERFDEFWASFPHRGGIKRGRKPAAERYARVVRSGLPEQTLIDAARRYASDKQVIDGFAKDPATWLNQAGWEDEVQARASPGPDRAAAISRFHKFSGTQP